MIRLILAVCWLLPSSLWAATFYVRQAGNDQADGRTAGTAYRTITRAAQSLNHGDAIVIGPGTYRESVLFAERFSADGAAMSVAGDETGKQTGDPAGPVIIQSASATAAALRFYRFNHLRIAGLTLRGPGEGISLEKSRQVTVERCTFDGLTRGLVASRVEGLRVESSVFTRNLVGLFLQGTLDIRVAHVSVAGSSSAGLVALGCGKGAIRNSIFAENNANLIADHNSAASFTSDHNVINGSTGGWGDVPTIANVYEWFAASGQDRHSVHEVPPFVGPKEFDLHIAPNVTWPGGLPGMQVGQPLEPKVEHDRDGRAFRVRGGSVCVGAYDYPDPQPGPGWKKLPAKLAGAGPRQSAALYQADGTLVRTLLADATGVSELWWDGRDDQGEPASAGKYVLKTVSHDVRVVDDGAFGDNGSPEGAYNCDNADHVVAMPDGGFVISTVYDEAGFPLRRYSTSGQPILAANLVEKDYSAIARTGEELYGVVGKDATLKLVRIEASLQRARMRNGGESYAILAANEKITGVTGLAAAGDRAYIGLGGLNVVRVLDLANGQRAADWPVAEVGDLAADEKGQVWIISGKEVVSFNAAGQAGSRYSTGLNTPRYLAAGAGQLAVVDRQAARIAILDAASGRNQRTIGRDRPAGAWMPVAGDLFRDPRGAAFLADGRLVVTESARVRILWPATGQRAVDILSNFMDVAVAHPTRPEFVYCQPGVFRVDTVTGAWDWLVEEPKGMTAPDKDGKPQAYSYGSPSTSVVLGGRPFIAYADQRGNLRLFDVSDPVNPRLALDSPHPVLRLVPYSIISFTKGGDIIANAGNYGLAFHRIPFTGLDPQGNPTFNFDQPVRVGVEKDPTPRGMKCINAPSGDMVTGDIYYLAVTDRYNKMVPGWGADGTGVGKSAPDGKPLWFALSSGGNYQSGAAIHDGKQAWYLAGKSFGGQIDLFDADGLRLTTGNWAWRCNYHIGFVDLRYGINPYRRPDGKIGAYVEDDAIGRFARCRIDGAETVRRTSTTLDWQPAGIAAPAPAAATELAQGAVIPRVAALPVDGDWRAWEHAGAVPQILSLPLPGFQRNVPDDLWQTFRAGTAAGALAYDGQNLYAYFVVADDTMHFDAVQGNQLWMFDAIELWIEEEQFGLGMTADGTPTLFKFRFHDLGGAQWKANYALPRENVWAAKLTDLSAHPLGRRLGATVGMRYEGQPGYAVMTKIPFPEIKLVGGIAGRGGQEVLNMTGQAGEIIRVGVSFSNISAWGREQDYKVNWPSTLMFSDPTRSYPFLLGK